MKPIKIHTIFFCTLLLFACGHKETTETENINSRDEQLVQVTAAQAKNMNLKVDSIRMRKLGGQISLNGQVEVPPQNIVSVSVPLGGYLRSTTMLPGTQIRKGQVLAVMEDPQYIQLQQDFLINKSKLELAQREFNRQRELNAGGASADKLLQQAQQEHRQLSIEQRGLAEKLRLIGIDPNKLTEQRISRTIPVIAPISGFVSKVNLNIGKYIMPSDVLFELINPKDMHLSLVVFEKDLNQIRIGQSVIAYSNADPDKKYEGRIELISQALNPDRSTEIHCHFKAYDKALVPGTYMTANVLLDQKPSPALPDEAIVNFENKDYVFVEEGSHLFRMTHVKKGHTAEGFTALERNLSGKRIVVQGAYTLLMKMKNTIEE